MKKLTELILLYVYTIQGNFLFHTRKETWLSNRSMFWISHCIWMSLKRNEMSGALTIQGRLGRHIPKMGVLLRVDSNTSWIRSKAAGILNVIAILPLCLNLRTLLYLFYVICAVVVFVDSFWETITNRHTDGGGVGDGDWSLRASKFVGRRGLAWGIRVGFLVLGECCD